MFKIGIQINFIYLLVIVQLDAQIPFNVFIYLFTPDQHTTQPSTRSDNYQKLY